jgi:glucuronyl/N-acetylglucosaminyl transferase EXT2
MGAYFFSVEQSTKEAVKMAEHEGLSNDETPLCPEKKFSPSRRHARRIEKANNIDHKHSCSEDLTGSHEFKGKPCGSGHHSYSSMVWRRRVKVKIESSLTRTPMFIIFVLSLLSTILFMQMLFVHQDPFSVLHSNKHSYSKHILETTFVIRSSSEESSPMDRPGSSTNSTTTAKPFMRMTGSQQSEKVKKRLLQEARDHVVAPLEPIDYTQYTIRINTWQRNEQLIASLNHHAKCEGVAQIQVVWCNADEEPPREVLFHPSRKVVVEYHVVNSLNERFNILYDPPTQGIFSVDDDVIRSCEALDNAFFKWTKAPDQIVGFDERMHGRDGKYGLNKMVPNGWDYLGVKATREENQYSMVLLRAAFLHRDYMDLYMTHLPKNVLNFVETNFNCEDIAMSYFVSHATHGKPPLLPDNWAIESMIKLHTGVGISTGDKDHKHKRHYCVTEFAKQMNLFQGQDNELQGFKRRHHKVFQNGPDLDPLSIDAFVPTLREVSLVNQTAAFAEPKLSPWRWNVEAVHDIMSQGLIPNTAPFEKRHNRYRESKRATKEELWIALSSLSNTVSEERMELYHVIKKSLQHRPWMHTQCDALRTKKKKDVAHLVVPNLLNVTYCSGIEHVTPIAAAVAHPHAVIPSH